MALPQGDRIFRVNVGTIASDDIAFRKMTVREELGRSFEIDLEVLSEDPEISPTAVLGQEANIEADRSEGDTRNFHGIVAQFASAGKQGELNLYRLKLVPWFWLLSLKRDCKILQDKNATEIFESIVKDDHNFTAYSASGVSVCRTREYTVQYRETTFDFLSRLLEDEGIYYYFTHESSQHTMMLCDNISSHTALDINADVSFFPPGVDPPEGEFIFEFDSALQLRATEYRLTSYDFTKPRSDLEANSVISTDFASCDHEHYDYPADYLETSEGSDYAILRAEEQVAPLKRFRGRTNARDFFAGGLFTLQDHPCEVLNAEYLITSTTQEIANNEFETGQDAEQEPVKWGCRFEAIESSVPFRPARSTPKPQIHGPQSAFVVGTSGEEIWTDQYGRIRVQFHWDRDGESDENSTCWLRVVQPWAGNTWGAQFLPRIGQEVVVDFYEGDPDRPVVTGSVYNDTQMPPFALPDNQTQSGLRTRSTKEGTAQNFNELRFEDKKDEEAIYLHAEKDFTRIVENDDVLEVGLEKMDPGNQSITVHNNQAVVIGNSDSDDGSQTIEIYKDQTTTLETGDQTIEIQEGSREVTIEGDDTLTINSGDQNIQLSQGNLAIAVDMGEISIEAMQSLELKVGGSSIKLEPSQITISGPMIAIEGDATAEISSASTTCEGTGMLTLKGGLAKIN